MSFGRGKLSVDGGKVAIDRGEFSNRRVTFSTRRVQVPRNRWRFSLVRPRGAGGGGQRRSGAGPPPRLSRSVNRASPEFPTDYFRVPRPISPCAFMPQREVDPWRPAPRHHDAAAERPSSRSPLHMETEERVLQNQRT